MTADPTSTVLVLASPDDSPTNEDRRFIRDFVRRGGVVLATGCGGASFLSRGGPSVSENGFAEKQTFDVASPSELTENAPRISMAVSCPVFTPGEHYVGAYGSREFPVVRTARIGK